MWTRFIWFRIETLAGSCEHGDEHTGSTKGGKIFDQMRKYQFLKNDPVPLGFELGVSTVLNPNDTAVRIYMIILHYYNTIIIIM